jgi:hypothetical protein
VAPEIPSDVERISVAPPVAPPAQSAPEAPEAPEAPAPVDVGPEVAAEPQAEWVTDGVLIGDPPTADSDGEPMGVTPFDEAQPQVQVQVPVPVPGAPESAPTWPPQLPPERAPVDGTVVPDEVPETKRRWFRSS